MSSNNIHHEEDIETSDDEEEEENAFMRYMKDNASICNNLENFKKEIYQQHVYVVDLLLRLKAKLDGSLEANNKYNQVCQCFLRIDILIREEISDFLDSASVEAIEAYNNLI
jgi:hypothetical protein